MAAIDKMYVHSYYDFNMFRKWALVYYPELIFYMYDFDLSYEEFIRNKVQWLSNTKAIIKKDYARLGKFEHPEDAVINVIEHYKKTANYDCPKAFPVINTPYKVDKKLLWICPVPCVREYLEKHCGYKTRWYHKLFWKGKKHF